MVKKFILALVCLLAPLGVRAQVNVVGNLKDAGVSNITGANTFVRMTLTGFGNNIPKVNGSNLIGRAFTDFHPDASGNIAGTIQGNDSITPSGTAYQVCIFDNGTQFKCNNYSVTGVGFNLNTAAPLIIGPTNSSGFISAPRVFEFQQGSPSTTWTINHNFGDKNVVFDCYDTFNKYLIPDTVVQTGIGTLTITFTSAQSGSCVVMTAQNVSVTNQPANAVVTNPTNTQVVNGATTTFQSPVNMIGANVIDAYNLNNIIAVDGVKYSTATAAFADPVCAAGTGCIIDMRGNSSTSALALGSFDPGATPVTLLLGPYTYSTSGITLRTNFKIYGSGEGGPTSTSTGTNIVPTSTSSPIIQMPATAPLGITGVHLDGFRILCASGNTNQIGVNITAPSSSSGLWYSTFSNLLIQGCGGEGILFSSAGYPEINQFLEFRSVIAIRKTNGAPALHIVGPAGQFIFTNCEFDAETQIGLGSHDNLPNVVVEDIVTPFVPTYNIAMYQTTIQGGGQAIKLRGTQNFTCDNCHFEHDYGVLNAAQGNNYGNYGVAITNSAIYTSGTNSGAGYLITMDINAQVLFDNNASYGSPDSFYLGDLTHLTTQGLFNQSNGQPFPSGMSSMRIAEGIYSDSSGFKFVSASTGPVSPNSRANVAITWSTPFADNGYAPFCFVGDFTTGATSQGVTVERQNTVQTGSGFSVTVFNPTGSTVTSNLYCMAVRSGS